MTDWPRGPVEAASVRRRSRVGAFALLGGKAVVSLVSVAVLALAWYGWQFVGNVNSGVTTTDVFDSEPQAVPLDGAIDILLVGQDSRTDAQGNPLPQEVLNRLHAGEANGERQTDTMILVHIPQDGTRAVAISFPRDSWVELAGGYGTHKLNSAFVYAYNDRFETLTQEGELDQDEIEQKAREAGRRNLIATIERFIGRRGMIDRYAEVNLASFYEVTKAIGGVEVCLNEPVRERNSGVNLPAGRQTLRGVQALAFVRQRYGLPNGDLDRIARQQAFLSGLVRKMLSSEVLFDPGKLSDVVSAVKKSVVLSKDWDLLQFAAQMRDLSGGNVEFHTIPVVGNAWVGGAAVLEVDQQRVRAFVDELVASEEDTTEPEPSVIAGAEEITVDVFNGSGDDGLGESVRKLLNDKGFQGEGYATVDVTAESAIRYHPGEESAVDTLRQALGETLPAVEDSSVASGTLSVVLGSDYELNVAASAGAGSAEPSFAGQAPPRRNLTSPSSVAQTDGAQDDPPITAGEVPCVN